MGAGRRGGVCADEREREHKQPGRGSQKRGSMHAEREEGGLCRKGPGTEMLGQGALVQRWL